MTFQAAATLERTGRRRVIGLAAAAAVAFSTLTGLVAAPSAHAAQASSAEAKMVRSINASRHSAHRSSLSNSNQLNAVARAWARKMAKANTLEHNPRLTHDVTNWRVVGENVGVGASVSQLHQAFMRSPGHRANVLSSSYAQVGIGVVSSHGRLWVVEVFRKPMHSTTAKDSKATKVKKVKVLRYGSHGTAVKRLQRKLHVRADGQFGRITQRHLKQWQKRHHLKVTGTLTASTRKKMHL